MSWKDLKIQYSIIVEKLKRKEDYSKEWAIFSSLAFEIEKNLHLQYPKYISL